MTALELITLAIALISACLSWYAIHKANKTAEENNRLSTEANQLQERIVAIEENRESFEKKARFSLEVQDAQSAWMRHIILKNVGNAAARNMSFSLDGFTPSEHPMFASWGKEYRERFLKSYAPTFLAAQSQMAMSISTEVEGVINLVITWEDDSSIPGRLEAPVVV